MSADEIRRDLEAARVEARRLAAEQQAWRTHVSELFDRAVAAGLSVDEIVESLGLSGKWAAHLERRAQLRRKTFGPGFFYGRP